VQCSALDNPPYLTSINYKLFRYFIREKSNNVIDEYQMPSQGSILSKLMPNRRLALTGHVLHFFPIKRVVTKLSAGLKRAYKIKHLCQVLLP
jgi:hypothetical protein